MRALLALSLVLTACTSDVFIGSDGGDASVVDATGDATPGPDAPPPADGGGPKLSIQCANAVCSAQICCQGATWGVSACEPVSAEGNTACLHYLACDDSTDCVQGEVCCASQVGQATGSPSIVTAKCQADCITPLVQLCQDNTECPSTNCQGYPGAPSWLKTCQ